MKKLLLLLLLILGNVLMYFIIKAYYRTNNIRFPYQNWYLSFKKDVTLREKFILCFSMRNLDDITQVDLSDIHI